MTPDLHTLGIDHLSMNEKLSLVHAIWDNIAQSNAVVPLSEAQQQEILRRTAKHDSGNEPTVSWDKVREEALARLKR
jgi:putative addiction module component (TIGR02574 family)